MQKRSVVLLTIVAILVVAVILAILLMPQPNLYKATVTGTVSYGFAGIGGWSATITHVSATQGDNLFPLGIISTGNIKVIATLTDEAHYYSAEANVGTLSSIVGGSVNYNVDVRQIPKGTYTLRIDVYEINYAYGIPFIEESRHLIKTITQTNVGIPAL